VKAYDSVQAYSIRASLERFNLPESFISYVLCNLENATSCFKTFFGPTDEFPIATSVRQGDPLSPLIYICITDALHEGLKENPIYNEVTGYRFSNNPDLLIASTGYADDTMIYSESWRHQWMMHEWVREFCHKHGFQLNTAKCKFFISDCHPSSDSRFLWSVDGKEKIMPKPCEPFRYLGVWLSLDLDWTKQKQVLTKLVMDWRWKAFSRKIDAAQLRASVTEYLFPRMEVGLAHADITQEVCDGWMSTIIYTICERGNMSGVHNLNRKAFCILSRIPDLWMRTQTTRATELLVNLNSENGDHGKSTVARLLDLTDSVDIYQATRALKENPPQRRREFFRFIPTLRYLKTLGVEIQIAPESSQHPGL
jgi:hypothetical protein